MSDCLPAWIGPSLMTGFSWKRDMEILYGLKAASLRIYVHFMSKAPSEQSKSNVSSDSSSKVSFLLTTVRQRGKGGVGGSQV